MNGNLGPLRATLLAIFFLLQLGCLTEGAEVNSEAKNATGDSTMEDFYAAVKADDSHSIEEYMRKPGFIDLTDSDGHSAFFVAVFTSRFDLAVRLVQMGAEIEKVDNQGWTAFCYAVLRGSREIVKFLIEQGIEIPDQKCGGSPLTLLAAQSKSSETMALVLAQGADPNAIVPSGATPLVMAMGTGPVKIVEVLLEAGADPNREVLGRRPLELAKSKGDPTLVKLLEKFGAKTSPPESSNRGNAIRQN